MIPHSIELKNFLSYGPELQKIDFEPYHLICLAGKNGHGKSGLLDAITWALWGQARKIAGVGKADAGLLRLGQTHMMVIFTFECNGNVYRLRREYLKATNKPITTLDVGILNPQTGSFESITDKSINITQDKIESLVGLSYDTFINSAFLRQGSSNEFSKKSPKERKEILAAILGLDRFEKLRKYTFEKYKLVQQDIQQATALVTHLREQIKEYDALAMHKTTISQNLSVAQQQVSQLATHIDAIEQQLVQLQNKLQEQAVIKTKFEAITNHENHLQAQLRTTYQEWRSIHAQLLRMTDVTRLYQQRQAIASALAREQQSAHTALAHKETLIAAQEQLQQHSAHVLKEQQAAQQQIEITIAQLHATIQHMQHVHTQQMAQLQQFEQEIDALQKEDAVLKKALQTVREEISTYSTLELQFEKRRTYYQKYIAEGNCIVNELTQLKQKKLFAQDSTNPTCPLCEQHLPSTRKRMLHTKFAHEESFLRHRLTRLTQLISRLKTVLVDQHTQLQALQQQQQELQLKEHRVAELQKLIPHHISTYDTLKQAHATLIDQQAAHQKQRTQLQTALADHHHQATALLEQDSICQQLRIQIAQLQQTIAQQMPASAPQTALAAQLQELDARIAQHAQIMQEKTAQEKRKSIVSELCMSLKQLKKDKQQLVDTLVHYAPLEHEQQKLTLERTEHIATLQAQRAAHETLLQTWAQLTQHLSLLDKLKQDCAKREQQIAQLQQEQEQFYTLIQALGKDGIQALLIEDALPEIEQETNTILAQLTDNQAHIRFESLRDLKSGGTKETLDINISDAQGIRPYEMFSGGEAFRIDFALRIAISKLLAHRAGATLQTLIIDEGFGSQDEEGLQQIINALYAIGHDFAKIIIVSHLSTMKNALPVQMVVHKGPNGSTINVVEQG